MPSISGRLFLSIPQDISVNAIEVKIVGSLKIPRPEINAGPCQGGTTVERRQILASSRDNSFRLPRGRYEFPFELPIVREMMDTITGVGHTYHSYEVRGVIHRHFYSDIESTTPLRIHRTPNVFYANLLDQVMPSYEEHPNEELNLRYRISIPTHIPFGASFPLRFEYSSLSNLPQKGQLPSDIHPRSITIHITETHALKVTPTASDAINYNNYLPSTFRKEHVILHQSYAVQRPARALLPESLDFDYSATIPVHLPRDFQACTQDVQSELIKVHHSLHFNVEFEPEPEGETVSLQRNKVASPTYFLPCLSAYLYATRYTVILYTEN
ncbi:hypothetical protein ASPBRDRAFT_190581 [Aspergillus brasiliensis CBS 101740]|uniref:Arrestin-like N-terminal domain-containing protein n=1 Tax=Aspergillus brasiliensis (strain CBS 101740 / IMI 381727 / IBT 21946) TaxID=767769 RepID=A0A1L9V026_ASPBC|nr:hypothetical protein ASPBRDRAFT_190581 [Aspergillus brasiliensis CBS 101740]